jgi:hypothetical protein
MERSSTMEGRPGPKAHEEQGRDDEVLLDALTQAGIHPAYREAVRRYAAEPDAQWRYCCGSSCDPCVEQIGRAVDAYRARNPQADG